MEENIKSESITLEKSVNKNKKFHWQKFKDQVIGVYKSGIYSSVAACAEAYNVPTRTLQGWLTKYNKNLLQVYFHNNILKMQGSKNN
ncbi:MAG: hypothetical protein ACK5Z5_04025 [Neisseriaceae bacterium]